MTQDRHHEEEFFGKAYDAHLTRRLLRYLAPYRARVVLAIVLLLGAAAVELVGPWLTKIALDRAIPDGDEKLLWILVGVYATSLIIGFALEYAQVLLTTWLGPVSYTHL